VRHKDKRRIWRWSDDLGGAALAFVFEIVIVAGLAVIAVLTAAIVMAAI
jgi:preprotein translocase subunit Sec61beta